MFRNWKVISEIPDRHLMWAMSLLDLNSEFGQQIAAKFPEYFQKEEPSQPGPVPISVMVERAKIRAAREGDEMGAEALVTYDGANDIPTMLFCACSEFPDLPEQLASQVEAAEAEERLYVGQEFYWEGKKLILLERSICPTEGHEYTFAPAEAVLVDCVVRYY